MTNPFVDPSEIQGGNYFKVKDHLTDLAILFEPKRVNTNVPSRYGTTDEIVMDVTVFKNQSALDNGTPEVLKGVACSTGSLVKKLAKLIDSGSATIATITPVQLDSGNSTYNLNPVGGDVAAKVGAYYTAREEAKIAARNAAPSFV